MLKICLEKAGIIKPNVPVVIGPRVPIAIIQEIADSKKSPLIQVKGDFETFEHENCAIAEAALKLLSVEQQALIKGLQAVPPCRIETLKIEA